MRFHEFCVSNGCSSHYGNQALQDASGPVRKPSVGWVCQALFTLNATKLCSPGLRLSRNCCPVETSMLRTLLYVEGLLN